MRFYTTQHEFYCGIDLHGKSMYICVLGKDGTVVEHRSLRTDPDKFLRLINPYREGIVVGVECTFSWYWLADLCSEKNICFVLGHAQYMKAIHGGKAKNDRIDSHKIAVLLRGGMFPMSYVYPRHMRATRDLLRRRMAVVRQRAEYLAHIQNTNTQYNLTAIGKVLTCKANRVGVAERFSDPSVSRMVALDLKLIDFYDEVILRLEQDILRIAKSHDPRTLTLLRTVNGIGRILSLVLLYEIHDIRRFPRVQDFLSYCRLVRCVHESAGKRQGTSGIKIGNPQLKWAFSEAAVLLLRHPDAKPYFSRLERKHGKAKALSVLTTKLGRTVYHMLTKEKIFDLKKFVSA